MGEEVSVYVCVCVSYLHNDPFQCTNTSYLKYPCSLAVNSSKHSQPHTHMSDRTTNMQIISKVNTDIISKVSTEIISKVSTEIISKVSTEITATTTNEEIISNLVA